MSELHWTRKSCTSASGTNWNKVLGGEKHEQSTNRKKWTPMCIMSLLEWSYRQYHNTDTRWRKCFYIWEYRKKFLLQKRYWNWDGCHKRMPVFQAKVWRLKMRWNWLSTQKIKWKECWACQLNNSAMKKCKKKTKEILKSISKIGVLLGTIIAFYKVPGIIAEKISYHQLKKK